MQGEALAFGESSMGGTLLVGLRPPRRVPPIEESPWQRASPFTKPLLQLAHVGCLTPKHPRKPKWLFADLGRLLLMQ
jgi:hypothetical protein